MARGGAVLAAVGGEKERVLRGALGEDADRVLFTDIAIAGRNPACIIPVWHEFLRDSDSAPALGIAESVWSGRSDAELVECSRHESLLNLAFEDGRDWRLVCPYDAALAPALLDDVRRTHPYVCTHGRSQRSGAYGPALGADELPAPAHEVHELPFGAADLSLVRAVTARRARAAGIADEGRVGDVVLAVNELATNSVCHGGGDGVLHTWQDNGTFLCEIHDRGHISDPLAGRERPPHGLDGGRGLWIVNHLCDLVQVRSTAAGTVVRLHMAV
jgi:anti-sigma regulatory factor (Ser/Thr protein kinase)